MSKYNNQRNFGILLGGVLIFVGVWPLINSLGPHLLLIGGGLIMIGVSIIIPILLVPVYRFWIFLGFILGWINSKILLSLIFYVFFAPVGIFRKIIRKDSMGIKFNDQQKSYWMQHEKNKLDDSMKYQF